jgi:hypothetical protein
MRLPLLSEVRVARAARPVTDRWQQMEVVPRDETLLGISFRPLQAEAFGLCVSSTLRALLAMPFDVVRLGAYWNRLEPAAGQLCFAELDEQVAAVEAAGKRIVLCVGAVKCFGYPEVFVPAHQHAPLPEGSLVEPGTHEELLEAAVEFVGRVVERYRHREAILAWQVEHEAVDPLGVEHSWRLSERFVRHEVDAVRAGDPHRPVVLNGFLPTSLPVRAQQWWRTRDQGDSLTVAGRLADIMGLDFYPRHALAGAGGLTCYLDGSGTPWAERYRRRLMERAEASGVRLMVAEGQAEPWEHVTDPPNPPGRVMFSCPPEKVIDSYSRCMSWGQPLWAYLFWGAEYWVLRQRSGDSRYLDAIKRILNHR